MPTRMVNVMRLRQSCDFGLRGTRCADLRSNSEPPHLYISQLDRTSSYRPHDADRGRVRSRRCCPRNQVETPG